MSKSPAHERAFEHGQPQPTVGEVFRDFAPFAWRMLRRLGVHDADIEDVCQEVFVTVHRKLPEFEGRSSIRTWLCGICFRVASDYRKQARWREIPSPPPSEPAIEAGQEDEIAAREARAVLDRILDRLDHEKRAVFTLYEIEELPMAEVAQALECPLQTAYSRLHAARREVNAAVEQLQKEGRLP